MDVFKAIVRFVSYVFHALLCIFLLLISALALAGGEPLHLSMLPWSGAPLNRILFLGSLFGLLTVFLALRSTLRFLFFLWSLAVVVLLVKGYFFSGYHFAAGEARTASYLVAASLVGLLGGWFQMWHKPRWRR